ncbi:MAG: SIR2 family protein [Limnochordia bacterium]|nr:SIR2 family protein [Limnochordia bacterium]
MVQEAIETRFQRLIDRVLDGGAVPFIGAGVSMNAITAHDERTIAKTEEMVNRLKNAIEDLNSCSTNDSLAQLSEEYLWKVYSKGNPYSSLVCGVLKIDSFTKLVPLPAHRYIAFLAREGCIEEIITSNYDICLSKAYNESFCVQDGAEDNVMEITDLKTYRQYSGKRRHNNYQFLKVYHINGCAKCLKDASDDEERESYCEKILLTESQLQDWRQRHWSREMLKDRLRTRSLVFSGFGSPEPQVRHTIIQVLEEFTSNPEEPSEAKGPWEHPNALFIHAYETLTFEQKQVLFKFGTTGSGRSLAGNWLGSANYFTGEDVIFFTHIGDLYGGNANALPRVDDVEATPISAVVDAKDGSRRLPADIFWQYVYIAVFWQLLMQHLERGSSFWYFVDSLVPCADALLQELRWWLLPKEPPDSKNAVFGRFPELLTLDGDSTRLSHHVWQMRHRGQPMSTGWYAALVDKCMLIPSFFLIAYLLDTNSDGIDLKWGEVVDQPQIGTAIYLNGKAGTGMLLCIAHHQCSFQDRELVKSSAVLDQINIAIQVIIGRTVKTEQGIIYVEESEDTVRAIPYYSVPLAHLLRKNAIDWTCEPNEVVQTFKNNIVSCMSIVNEHRERFSAVAVPL